MRAPVIGGFIRRITKLELDWRRAFAQGLNLEFLGIEYGTGGAALRWHIREWSEILDFVHGEVAFQFGVEARRLGGLRCSRVAGCHKETCQRITSGMPLQ